MSSAMKKMIPVWGIGLVLLALRYVEKTTGFDAGTGLTVPTSVRGVLIAGVAAAAVYAVLAGIRKSGKKPAFEEHFARPGKMAGVLITGSFLLMAGGVLQGYQAMGEEMRIALLAAGAFAAATGFGLIFLTKQMERGEARHVAPLLPALFFNAFWVLSLYLPAGSDPILARYWLPILASAMNAYAFAQLAGFFRQESKVRSFDIVARLAVMLCIASAAESGIAGALLFAGNAVAVSAFLALEKE